MSTPESSERIRITSPDHPLVEEAAKHIAGHGRGTADMTKVGAAEAAVDCLTRRISEGATVIVQIGPKNTILAAGFESPDATEDHGQVMRWSGAMH